MGPRSRCQPVPPPWRCAAGGGAPKPWAARPPGSARWPPSWGPRHAAQAAAAGPSLSAPCAPVRGAPSSPRQRRRPAAWA
eukprot:2359509-Lingulodinium_polyedra.AAC.1